MNRGYTVKKISFKQIPTSCVILFIIALIFVFWGSYQLSLGNMGADPDEIVVLENGTTDEQNEGQYVLAAGKLTPENNITDPDTGVSVDGLILIRRVEMYQYAVTGPNSVTADFYFGQNKNIVGDGGEEYTNPVLPEKYRDNITYYPKLTISGGNAVIDERYISALENNDFKANFPKVECETVPVTQIDPSSVTEGFKFADGYLTNGDPLNPQIGDIRISYSYIPADSVGEVSVFGKQTDNVIGKEDGAFSFIASGIETAQQADDLMFGRFKSTARTMYIIAAILVIIAIFKLVKSLKKGGCIK